MMDWNDLHKACMNCDKCALADTRTNVVFGTGNPNANVLLVGEAPGEDEDLAGEPFVGYSGKILNDFLDVIGLYRHSNVYIANIVKCRPPENRDPLHIERRSCLPFLRNQVLLMNPKIIVCVGRIAATTLIDPDFKITEEHGIFYEKEGIEMVGFYHPAALRYGKNRRQEFLEDMKKLRQKINEVCPETYETP